MWCEINTFEHEHCAASGGHDVTVSFQCGQTCDPNVSEVLADELFGSMNVSDSQSILQIPKRQTATSQWAVRPASGRPVLAKAVRALVQYVFRCHLLDTTVRFAGSPVLRQ